MQTLPDALNGTDLEAGSATMMNKRVSDSSYQSFSSATTRQSGSFKAPIPGLTWSKAARLVLTVVLYVTISYAFALPEAGTVVYTCSDGHEHVAPRAVNSRFDTIFETVGSEHSEDVNGYFCKVRAGKAIITKYPRKRIVYVDSDSLVDLQGVIQDAGCSRMTIGIHPGNREFVSTSWFCFPADENSARMLDKWYSIRENYPKHPRDQQAMRDLIDEKAADFKVAQIDSTGIELAHCSHALGSNRELCNRNLSIFAYWDRFAILLWSSIRFFVWLLPLSVAFGYPLMMPGAVVGLLNVNPLTILAAFGLPRVLGAWFLRSNKPAGQVPKIYHLMFSRFGMFWLRVGPERLFWVPLAGPLQVPQDDTILVGTLLYAALFCCMVVFRKRLDRWTCITCPTLWHWVAWSKHDSSCMHGTNLWGTGRWLSVDWCRQNGYQLNCTNATTRGQAGVPVHEFHACGRSRVNQCRGLQDARMHGQGAIEDLEEDSAVTARHPHS